MSSLFFSSSPREPEYRFFKSKEYPVSQLTTQYQIQYYVNSDWSHQYNSPKLQTQFGQMVEATWVAETRQSCRVELSRKHKLQGELDYWKSSIFGNRATIESLEKKLQNFKAPNCDDLNVKNIPVY
jgi:hypothetical protein